MGLLLKVLQQLEKRTESWPPPPLSQEPVAELGREVLIHASCQAVWDQIEAPTAHTHATDPRVKVVLLGGPPFEDGEPRSLAFRTTDQGQLSVHATTVVSEQPPHESVRRIIEPQSDMVEMLERHTLTEVPEGCHYRVKIECRTALSRPVTRGLADLLEGSIDEFVARIKYLFEPRAE